MIFSLPFGNTSITRSQIIEGSLVSLNAAALVGKMSAQLLPLLLRVYSTMYVFFITSSLSAAAAASWFISLIIFYHKLDILSSS